MVHMKSTPRHTRTLAMTECRLSGWRCGEDGIGQLQAMNAECLMKANSVLCAKVAADAL